MCGLVGCVGSEEAAPVILEGLEKLEYRGYDSTGISILSKERIIGQKAMGQLSILREKLEKEPIYGSTGVGHTRWATHGRPLERNAHPQYDCEQEISVAHNGIIENYLELQEELREKGHIFVSETDTEVIPHLIEEYYEGDLVLAVQKAISKLDGAFALAVIAAKEPGKIIAVRQSSPLIVGLGKGENLVASDIPAILHRTRDVYILEDGEMAEITRESVKVMEFDGTEIKKDVFHVTWDAVAAEKNGYEDFMIKEIFEQPQALRDTLTGKVDRDHLRVTLPEVGVTKDDLRSLKKISIVACGTAYHAGLVGKHIFERLLRIPVEVEVASEYRYRGPMVGPEVLTVVISQSGETADTLGGLRLAKAEGSRILSITNVIGSSAARESHDLLLTMAGPEIAVASTKAYTTQLLCLNLLGIFFAQELQVLSEDRRKALVSELLEVPRLVEKVLTTEAKIKELAEDFRNKENIFFIGRGLDYAVAQEGALKLKEISYIHAEAYAAGELKHGTLALVVEGVPVFALATQPTLYDKMLSNIKEVKARDATVVALVNNGDYEREKSVDYVLYIPKTHPFFTPILSVVPLQLFAYHTAKARGCDVDKPRNLAKSVTVE
ncbi:MAG TPA: glutamine--fructose-6-phosphate transaminase (isomerizing) [Firmicutes bacterium]|nr:glutamine--fructose-6-phosphate transaminase (isomerizing) [Bacillota bacterium]